MTDVEENRRWIDAVYVAIRVAIRELDDDLGANQLPTADRGGYADEGFARVEKALRLKPKYAHAHWDRAQMLWGKQDYAGTATAVEAFLALVPTSQDATRVRAMLAEARLRASPSGRPGATRSAILDSR